MLILVLPFINTFSILIFGRYLSVKGVVLNTMLIYGVVTYLLCGYLYQIYVLNNVITIELFNIIPIINFGLTFDKVSLGLLTPVILITFLVNFYTKPYLTGDPFHIRFYGFLNLFSSFMIMLVLSNNLLLLFFSWEGIGLASFMLISYYYNSSNSIKSALSAFYINKLGDLFLVLGVILIIFNIHEYSNLIGFALVIAATTKSAQYPFYKWLPESMAAPTPVSSLLHAATLVTAGVYLIIKTYTFINTDISIIVLLAGASTTIITGVLGFYTWDIKRIIAYSTASQIAMCFIALGVSQYSLALYHLFNHSFYKALLFLSAGVIIHYMYDEQDVRKYGGLYHKLPITRICFFIAGCSLMAFPGLSGFYSKDLIIESSIVSKLAPAAFFSGWLTIGYTFNLFFSTFIRRPVRDNTNKESESFWYYLPLIILTLFSIFVGYYTIEYKNLVSEDFYINDDYEFLIKGYQKWFIFIITFFVIGYNAIETFCLRERITEIPLMSGYYIPALWNAATVWILKYCNSINNVVEQGFIKNINEVLIWNIVQRTNFTKRVFRYENIYLFAITVVLLGLLSGLLS